MIQSKFFDLYLVDPCAGKDMVTRNAFNVNECIQRWRVKSNKQGILSDPELGWVRGNVKRSDLIWEINVIYKPHGYDRYTFQEYEHLLNQKTLTNQVRTFTRSRINNIL